MSKEKQIDRLITSLRVMVIAGYITKKKAQTTLDNFSIKIGYYPKKRLVNWFLL